MNERPSRLDNRRSEMLPCTEFQTFSRRAIPANSPPGKYEGVMKLDAMLGARGVASSIRDNMFSSLLEVR